MPARHRRSLVVAALGFAVATVAVLGAMYRAEPSIGLRTGGGPQAQELRIRPQAAPAADSPTSAPGAPTTTAARAPSATPPTTGGRTAAGEPVGCVPGTFVEQGHSCRWKPVSVSGRVVDSSGRAVPGVCVRPTMLSSDTVARTDGQGRYAMVLTQGGVPLSADACADTRPEFGWVPGGPTFAPSMEPGTSAVVDDIVLTERGGVFGRVVDHDGNPLAGVCIAGGAASDADGFFTTQPLQPGRHHLGAFGGGTAGCPTVAISMEQVPVDVVSGQWSGPVTVPAIPQTA